MIRNVGDAVTAIRLIRLGGPTSKSLEKLHRHMSIAKYSMSFTTGALLHRESIVVAELFNELADWSAVRDSVVSENRLQMRTLNASKRVYREVASRLKQLIPLELEILVDGAQQDQRHILWLAICKRYRFIYDFAVEVVREKFLRLDLTLSYSEYDSYYNAKAEWHPEVERATPATREKQRQTIFRMMHEADLLTADHRILPTLLSPRVVDGIRGDSANHFAIFPVSPAEAMR